MADRYNGGTFSSVPTYTDMAAMAWITRSRHQVPDLGPTDVDCMALAFISFILTYLLRPMSTLVKVQSPCEEP